VESDQFLTVVADGPGFVRITVSGPSTGARLHGLLQRIVVETKSRGTSRVLVDGREVPAPIPTADKYDIGVATAQALGGRIKLAVVASPANVDQFFATVARSGGTMVLEFTDETAALAWLMGAEAATPRSPESPS
jgi:hypothetical protein